MIRAGFWITVLAILVGGVTACTPPEEKPPPDKIVVQLKWFHQAQFAGFYLAQENGFYAAENLDVRFLEGGKSVEPTATIINGLADFAVAAPEDVLISRSRGLPITAIAAIYRRSAVVFVSKTGSGIERPFDFVGKSVAVGSNPGKIRDLRIQFTALASKLGIDTSLIHRKPFDPSYQSFIDGNVDVTPTYITGGAIRLKTAGFPINIIWPGDYGIHFYSDTLVTNEKTISERPEVVTRFLRATLEGWKLAVGDLESAVAATLKYAKPPDAALQSAMMEASMPLVHTGEDHIGWMKRDRWQSMIDILAEQGILSAPLPDVDSAHSLRFLTAVYGDRP